MLEFVGEVALDLVGLVVNPDVKPLHPVACAVAAVAVIAWLAAGLAGIYLEDGVIAL